MSGNEILIRRSDAQDAPDLAAVGSASFRAAYAEDRLADGLWLLVWREAEWVINAYDRQGFRVVGQAEFELGSTVYNDLLMW